jgi:hypothetical protein
MRPRSELGYRHGEIFLRRLQKQHPWLRFTASWVLLAAVGCTGFIGDAGDNPGSSSGGAAGNSNDGGASGGEAGSEGGSVDAGPCVQAVQPRSVWPLSNSNYDITVNAALGDTSKQAETNFPADSRANGYASNEDAYVVDSTRVGLLMTAAETIASNVGPAQLANVKKSCTPSAAPSGASPDPCVMQYVQSEGKVLYRRPLTTTEASGLYATYLTGFQYPDPGVEPTLSGIQTIIATMLYSPEFLYRTELGDPSDTTSNPVTMTQYEIASEIAYAATGGPPDATLIALADSGSLNTATAYQQQLQRLVNSPNGHAQMAQFVMEWVGADTVMATAGGGPVTAALAQDMITETADTIEQALFSGSATLAELLTANYTYVNADLAAYYGMSGVSGATFTKVTQPSNQGRMGILGQGSFLTASAQTGVRPLHRGKVMLEQLLCEDLPSFASLGLGNFTPPPFQTPPAGTTTRASLQTIIGTSGVCAECHQNCMYMGFGLENFDAYGRYQATDNGGAVDSSGFVPRSTDLDPATGQIINPQSLTEAKFTNYASMASVLSQDPRVGQCFAKQIVVYASGRSDIANNDCAVSSVQSSVQASNGTVMSGFGSYVQSEQFVQRSR